VWIKVIIVLTFIGIVASLASGLFYLVNDKGDSRRTLRALTMRIGLSIGLFVFLMILIGLGVTVLLGKDGRSTTTDSDGSYEFGGFRTSGAVALSFEHPQYDSLDGRQVTIDPTGTVQVDVQLTGGPDAPPAAPPAATTDEGGEA